MRRIAVACLAASAAAFLGRGPALPVKTAKAARIARSNAPAALQMSSALAEESGIMDLSQGAGMFTSSNPEDRRIGQELHVAAS